ncbi:hypothetical protein FOPG_19716 [Fusarium oxysporum f. sp. conglutinans race 2 54008]|uniref:Uncharacterized protein n=1 Tax=Fusarium oxysporum f. sp. conglutinans race 2 54008 TaxID=1089457 RepID=X0GL24_FUSOX|nr:hypothetical protein FOPG_19716 [Fusarium oxysporum f. sp. conglutinans race 2 54008]
MPALMRRLFNATYLQTNEVPAAGVTMVLTRHHFDFLQSLTYMSQRITEQEAPSSGCKHG